LSVSDKALGQHELWFIAGSQEMYGEAVLSTVAADAREIAAGLDASAAVPVRVLAREIATTQETIRRLCLDANADDACVGVILWMHTFSPAKMWIAGLGALRKPLLHLHTQFHRSLPWAQIDMEYMNTHQSAHGDREFGFLETRMRIARKTVVGHWRDAATLERIGRWSRAAVGWSEASRLTVARFGDNMRAVAVTEGDKLEAQLTLGFTVSGFGVGDLVDVMEQLPQETVDGLVASYDASYEMAEELRHGGTRRDSLIEAARIEAALREFLERGGFGAFTDTFEDLHGLRQLPGIAVQRLMADGYGFGGEGDWKTAALVRIVKLMSAGLPGGSSFMEDYTYDLSGEVELVLGSHMLEVCPSIADARPSCEIHPLSIGAREDPVRLVFNAAPGPAVMLAMLDMGDRFRMVAAEVDTISPPQPLPKLPVARAVWKPRPDFATATEAWLLAGGPHHSVYTTAIDSETLLDFAEIAGLELLLIDEHTRMRDFRNELRWNSAYHRLAAGL
jgi:L-arabinose isomerase